MNFLPSIKLCQPHLSSRYISKFSIYKVIYFIYFASTGIIGPHLPVFYFLQGYSKSKVGLMSAISPVIGFLASPVFMYIVDKYSMHQQVVYFSLFSTGVLQLSLYAWKNSFVGLMTVVVLWAIVRCPVGSILDAKVILDSKKGIQLNSHDSQTDSSTMRDINSEHHQHPHSDHSQPGNSQPYTFENADSEIYKDIHNRLYHNSHKQGTETITTDVHDRAHHSTEIHAMENTSTDESMNTPAQVQIESTYDYGDVRLWGSIGYGVAALTGGAIIARSEWSYFAVFILAAFLRISLMPLIHLVYQTADPCAHVNSTNNHNNHSATRHDQHQTSSNHIKPEFSRLFALFLQPHVAWFYLILAISGISMGVIDIFIYVHLSNLGATQDLMGLGMIMTCIAEVPFMKASPWLIHTWGVFGVLILTQSAYVIRFLCYANLTIPWHFVLVELLHGCTYGLHWTATAHFAAKTAPPGLETSSQSMAGNIKWGLGFSTGGVIGGYLFTKFGAVPMFKCFAFIMFLSVLVAATLKWMNFDERVSPKQYTVVDVNIDNNYGQEEVQFY